jgi:peptidoglycan/LPS O-acetylase OafA/YrhL
MSGRYGREIIHSLDGLRGIAALVVVERHARHWFGGWMFSNGHLAVDFFFLLSGFVLSRAYDAKLESGMPLTKFMKSRVLRLYPLYLMGIILITAACVARDQFTLVGLLFGFFFLPNVMLPNFFWYVPASWSLFFELVINAAYGAIARVLTTPVLCVICAFAAAVLLTSARHYHSMDTGFRGAHFWGGGARVLFSFPAGILAYRLRDVVPPIKGAAWPCAALLVGIFFIQFPPAGRQYFQAGMVIGLFPLILLLSARSSPGNASASAFAVLGMISYPIYVLHGSVVKLVDIGWIYLAHHKHPAPLMGVAIILLLAVICYGLAIADERLRRNVGRGTRRSTPQVVAAE